MATTTQLVDRAVDDEYQTSYGQKRDAAIVAESYGADARIMLASSEPLLHWLLPLYARIAFRFALLALDGPKGVRS